MASKYSYRGSWISTLAGLFQDRLPAKDILKTCLGSWIAILVCFQAVYLTPCQWSMKNRPLLLALLKEWWDRDVPTHLFDTWRCPLASHRWCWVYQVLNQLTWQATSEYYCIGTARFALIFQGNLYGLLFALTWLILFLQQHLQLCPFLTDWQQWRCSHVWLRSNSLEIWLIHGQTPTISRLKFAFLGILY